MFAGGKKMSVERRISKDLINPLSKDYLSSHRVRKILGREFCKKKRKRNV